MSAKNLTEWPDYWAHRRVRTTAKYAAGVPTRTIGGFEVDSAVTLQPEDPMTAWLAALMDGEGHFGYNPPKISINMCDVDVLEKALACTGVGALTGPYKRGEPHHKPIYRWRVSRAADCWVICHLILPWLGIRRTQEALRQCESFRTMTAGKVMHGTRAYYKRGCRCESCCEAQRLYARTRDDWVFHSS
jgi:hypothetical protein